MSLRATVVRAKDLDAAHYTRWHQLLAEAPVHSAFLSPDYAQAADTAFGNVHVGIFDSGAGAAYLPFALPGLRGKILRAASPAGEHFADYFGLVASPSFRISPQDLLAHCGLHAFLFTHLDDSQQTYGLSGEKPARGLRIRQQGESGFIAELHERDKKFANDTERRLKKLTRDHGELRFAVEAADGDTLDWVIARKLDQYRRTGKRKHPFSTSADHQFLRTLARIDHPHCRPRLTSLYCGERRIAAHFGLQCLDTLSYWFPVYDPELHSYSPGRLLLWETLRQAESLGIRCIDRGEGDTQAKRDFANEEHVYLRGYYARNSLRSLADRAINALSWRISGLAAPAGD